LFAGALLASSASNATSIVAIKKHDPKSARPAIERFVQAIDADDVATFNAASSFSVSVYSDELGEVETNEGEAFVRSMNYSEGEPDDAPIAIASIRPWVKHQFYPIYLVVLERELWRTKQYGIDEMLEPVEIDRPHFETTMTTWIVAFRGDKLFSFRQADELYFVANGSSHG
jgi:hypothetical protein